MTTANSQIIYQLVWPIQSIGNKNGSWWFLTVPNHVPLVMDWTLVLVRWLFGDQNGIGMNLLLHLSVNVTHQSLPKYHLCDSQMSEQCEMFCHMSGMQ